MTTTADALRRLQALRGLTRTGSAHAVLAALQGDLQTVIEAVLELAACGEDVGDEKPCPCVLRSGHDGEHACLCENPPALPATAPEGDEPVTDEPAVGGQVTDSDGDVWQRFEDGWLCRGGLAAGWSSFHRTWDHLQVDYGPLRATTDDARRRVGLPVRDENTPPASQNGPQGARNADSGTGGPPEPENGAEAHDAFPLFVAPDGFDNPTIWWGEREVLLRTDANADAFDALAGLVRAALDGDA